MIKNAVEQSTEKCIEMFQSCCVEPMTALTELNSKTVNNLLKSDHVKNLYNEFFNAKKIEDVLEAQRKFMAHITSFTTDYFQQLSNLTRDCSANMSQHMHSAMNEASRMGTEAIKPASAAFKAAENKVSDKK